MGKASHTFKLITDRWNAYKDEIETVLRKYQSAVDHIKNEETAGHLTHEYAKTRIAEVRENDGKKARANIAELDRSFADDAAVFLAELRGEIAGRITAAPPSGLVATAKLYHDFGIVPTKAELYGMLEQAGDNYTALRIVQSLTNDFDIPVPDMAQFEKAISDVETRLNGRMQFAPDGLSGAYAELFPQWQFTAQDGSGYQNGTKTDTVRLLTNAAFCDETFSKNMLSAAEAWDKHFIPTLRERVELNKQKIDEAMTEYREDRERHTAAMEVADKSNSPEVVAAKIGAQVGISRARAKEVLRQYTEG